MANAQKALFSARKIIRGPEQDGYVQAGRYEKGKYTPLAYDRC
jgi:hypothetical protein